MANKRINELALRTPQTTDLMLIGDPTTGYSYKTTLLSALNLGVPTTRTITINGTTFDLSANRTWSVGTVTSVGLTMPAAFNVASSPVTGSGTIAVTAAGLATQYIRGDGTLADFPGGGGGGGASVSYYLNGSVNQGTIGGIAFREMNKTPILGAGTNFTTNTNGYIASFITDPGDPALLKIPGGNWNTEFYFAASSGGGTPTYYLELYKYDGTTFTLIASNSSNPDAITGGTSVEQYFTTLAVPETILTATDRLAIRIYVTTAGRTITLHTENSNLCQIITTFTTGLTALNGLTAQVQYFATGSAGTDFNISSSTATHTFNIPTASATNRGLLSTADWTTFNNKVSSIIAGNAITISNASGNVTINHADTSGADPGATISGSNVFRSIVLDTYGHVTGLSYSSFLISDLGGTAISSPSNGQVLSYNGTNWVNSSLSGLSIITGSGTTNWIPKFTSSSAIGLSNIYDGGSFIGVFTATDNLSGAKLQVSGAATFSSTITATRGIFGTTGTGTFGVHISDNDQSNVRLRFTNTGTGGQAFSLVGGNPGASNAGFAIYDETNAATRLYISSTGAATFSSSVTAVGTIQSNDQNAFWLNQSGNTTDTKIWAIQNLVTSGTFRIRALNDAVTNGINAISITRSGISSVNLELGGNVGIGATPSAWTAFNPVLQIKTGSLGSSATSNFRMFANTYYDGSYKYIGTGTATQYEQDGYHAWYTAPSGTAGNAITFTQRMTLNASGNLGLGVTPSAWWSGVSALQVSGASLLSSGNTSSLTANAFLNSTPQWIYRNTAAATHYEQTLGEHRWYNAPSGTAGNAITFTQAMTLTASGNLGIGTTSPTEKLDVIGGALAAGNGTIRTGITYSTLGLIGTFTNHDLGVITNGSERMRITSGGNVGIGTTSPSYPLTISRTISATQTYLSFNNATNAKQNWGIDWDVLGTPVPVAAIRAIYPADNDISLGFYTYNGSGNVSERMRITTSGNVGIGTASPSELLQVGGGSGAQTTPTAIRMDDTYRTGGDAFDKLKFYLYKSSTETYGLGLGVFGDVQYWAGTNSTGVHRFFTSQTERLRITSSGRTLIGTTTDNTVDLLQVAGTIQTTSYINLSASTRNFYLNPSADFGSGAAPAVQVQSNHALQFATNNLERMRITSGGNVGIGTTSILNLLTVGTSSGSSIALTTDQTNGSNASPKNLDLKFLGYLNGDRAMIRSWDASANTNDGILSFWTNGSSFAERMRITSGGNVLVNRTTASTSAAILDLYSSSAILICTETNNNSTFSHHDFRNGNGVVGSITTNGTATAYNTSSDYRLKYDYKDYNGLDIISKMKSYDFAWKSDNKRMYGLIAHELQEILEYAVVGEKDGEQMQGVDYSKIVPVLVKAIQELKTELDTLKK